VRSVRLLAQFEGLRQHLFLACSSLLTFLHLCVLAVRSVPHRREGRGSHAGRRQVFLLVSDGKGRTDAAPHRFRDFPELTDALWAAPAQADLEPCCDTLQHQSSSGLLGSYPCFPHDLRRAPTWAACLGAPQAPLQASPTQRATRRPPSSGARTPSLTTC
jgi:hypothetical protein